MHFCETDEVMRVISSQLLSFGITFEEWWEKSPRYPNGQKNFSLPLDEKTRTALLYKICLKIFKKDISVIGFVDKFFSETSINLLISWFNSSILRPLTRSISHQLDEISYNIQRNLEGKEDIPITVLYVYQDHSVNIGDSNIFSGDAAIGGGTKLEKKENS